MSVAGEKKGIHNSEHFDVEKSSHLDVGTDAVQHNIEEYDPEMPEEAKNMPVLTLRVIVIGTIFNFIWAFINQIGNYRTVPFFLDTSSAFLISYPVMALLARYVPSKKFSLFGMVVDTNPGPFNMREHLLIAVCTTEAAGTAYVANTLAFMELNFGQNIGWLGDFLLIICTKMIGLGLAGVFYRILIASARVPWPQAIYTVEIFKMLHSTDGNKRLKVFGIIFVCFFAYYWVPGLLWPGLGAVSALCWFAGAKYAGDSVFTRLFSGAGGYGVLAIDLNVSNALGIFPFLLYIPAWLAMNAVVGGTLQLWLMGPLMYFYDFESSASLPVVSTGSFLKNGTVYPTDSLFDDNHNWVQSAYEEAGPMYLTAFFSSGYFFSFVALSATVSHTLCWHLGDIKKAISEDRRSISKHHQNMLASSVSSTIPVWLGAVISTVLAVIFIGTNLGYDIDMPWWAVIVSVLIAVAFILPIGIITGVTGNQLGLNILAEMMGGFMLSHNPVGAILVKVTGYMSMSHAITLVQNLKAGQYLQINYKQVLLVQAYGTVITALADTTAYRLVMDNNLLTDGGEEWNSRALSTYITASYLWGGIGPWDSWMNPSVSPYWTLFWGGIAAGFVLPVVFWLLSKKVSVFRYIHIPMMCLMPAYPYETAWVLTMWMLVLIFNFLMPAYAPRFHKKYVYIIVAGMASSVAICSFIISILEGFAGVSVEYADTWRDYSAGCHAVIN